MPDLFDQNPSAETADRPLAARMRPRTLDEFVGQQHIAGPESLLRRAIADGKLPSMIFYGPPGCGKTTLAHIIESSKPEAAFEAFSAVTSGVADIRQVIARAKDRRKLYNRQTILFVDEIHHFNKAQQDAFLPHIEDGTVILIGATTENPYFEVNSPLISRSRIFQFEPLAPEDVTLLVERALQDGERGLGAQGVKLEPEALEHLVDVAGGDARTALNALEAAVLSAPEAEGGRLVTRALIEEALQQRALGYDRAGDSHFDTISAFIKSMRGSDPDAAVYWLAKMIAAGEDPRFIARRIVIQAAEDVGNADPMALVVATSAAHAVEYVGLPEAQIPLAQAAIYLACAPKSNASYLAINRALEDVKKRSPARVPPHLRSTGYRGAEALGSGVGYIYPHDHPGHIAAQEYLPPGAKSRDYYVPGGNGYEKKIKERLARWAEELKQREKR